MLILQIGDRPLRRDQDAIDLKQQGIHRERVHTTQEAILFIKTYDFDVVLADLDLLGLDPIREIRALSRIPIIGITTSPDPRIKIGALDLGADDVITQFCGLEELLARIRAVVRRRYGLFQSAIRCGRIEIDLAAREARVDDLPLRLGPKEYLLLEFLILKRGTAVSKVACMTRLYGTDDHPEAKTIDVVLCRLRKRLAPHGLSATIESVWGFGYKLSGSPEIPTGYAASTLRQERLVPAHPAIQRGHRHSGCLSKARPCNPPGRRQAWIKPYVAPPPDSADATKVASDAPTPLLGNTHRRGCIALPLADSQSNPSLLGSPP